MPYIWNDTFGGFYHAVLIEFQSKPPLEAKDASEQYRL